MAKEVNNSVQPIFICESCGTTISITTVKSTTSTATTSTSTKATTSTATTTTSTSSTSTSSTSTTLNIWVQVPINIKNAQSTATSVPFQQEVDVISANYWNYENGNLQNVEFYYPNGTVIPSWLEDNWGNKSVKTPYWLKFTKSLPANSNITIYMGFAAPNVDLFNGKTIGSAPLYSLCGSGAYGSCDNGANVFNFYDNFAGTTLNTTKWVNNCANSGNTCTINNELIINNATKGNNDPAIYSKSFLQGQGILEFYGVLSPIAPWSSGPYCFSIAGISSSSNINDNLAAVGNFCNSYNDGLSTSTSSGSRHGVASGWGEADTQFLAKYSIIIPSGSPSAINAIANTSNGPGEFADQYKIYSTSDLPTLPEPIVFQYQLNPGLEQWFGSIWFNWVRSRAYPPSGVMPSVTFGSVNVIGTTTSTSTSTSSTTSTTTIVPAKNVGVIKAQVPIIITNGQSTATSSPFQQELDVKSFIYNSYESNNSDPLQNVEFYYTNGTIINSWLEDNGGSKSLDSQYWLKLTNSIPADSSVTIYMGFAPTNVDLFNGNTIGVDADSGCGSGYQTYYYGICDNGANVFSFYDNFAGGTLNTTKWVNNCAAAGNTCIVNNALFISNSVSKNNLPAIYTKNYLQGQGIMEFYTASLPVLQADTGSSYTFAIFGSGSSSNIANSLAAIGYYIPVGASYPALITSTSTGNKDFVNNLCYDGSYIYSIIIPSNTPSYITANSYSYPSQSGGEAWCTITSSQDMPTLPQPIIFANQQNSSLTSLYLSWARARAYPPSGIMPAAKFGSLEVVNYPPPITISTPQPSNSLLDYGQSVTYTAILSSNAPGPFTVNLLENGNVINSLKGQSTGTINLGTSIPPIGTDVFYVTAANSTSNTFSSAANTIVVYPNLN